MKAMIGVPGRMILVLLALTAVVGCRSSNTSASLSTAGDEFVVVLPGMDQAQALGKASEIRTGMKNTVYALEPGIEVRLQASFGVATFPEHAGDAKGLIAAADQALFAVKDAGKNAIGRFQTPLSLCNRSRGSNDKAPSPRIRLDYPEQDAQNRNDGINVYKGRDG